MNIIRHKSLESTQIEAKKYSDPWTVIVAETQTSGHGKSKSSWHSEEGGLYFSIVLPKIDFDDLQTITILAAFVVSKTLKEEYDIEPMIKLPNDVYVNGKKICGILTENVIGQDLKSSVIGIGINLNNKNFPVDLNATSVILETGERVDLDKIMQTILEELKHLLSTII